MDVFQNVLYGFQVALQPINLIYCFFGVLIGTLVGVLPGLGPASSHRPAPSSNIQSYSGFSDHHVGRDLLWGHVWRFYNFDFGEHSW